MQMIEEKENKVGTATNEHLQEINLGRIIMKWQGKYFNIKMLSVSEQRKFCHFSILKLVITLSLFIPDF